MKKYSYSVDVSTFTTKSLRTPYDDCLVGITLSKGGKNVKDTAKL